MNHFALNGVISPQELYYYALRAVAMLIVIPFHESAHALISWKLGDSTAKDMGRLSMNPLRHFDQHEHQPWRVQPDPCTAV